MIYSILVDISTGRLLLCICRLITLYRGTTWHITRLCGIWVYECLRFAESYLWRVHMYTFGMMYATMQLHWINFKPCSSTQRTATCQTWKDYRTTFWSTALLTLIVCSWIVTGILKLLTFSVVMLFKLRKFLLERNHHFFGTVFSWYNTNII